MCETSLPERSGSFCRRFALHLTFLFLTVPLSPLAAQVLDSASVLLSGARLAQAQKNYPESIEKFKSYLRAFSAHDDVRNELARTFAWSGAFDSAVTHYEIVLATNRANFDALYGLCQALAWKGDFERAIRVLDQLRELKPTNKDVLLLAGNVYQWSANHNNALEMYKTVLSMDTKNEEAALGNARALQSLGKKDQAYNELARFRTTNPRSDAIEQLYEELGARTRNQLFVRYQQEQFDVARSDYRTFTVQYYRTFSDQLTAYGEFDTYRRFDQDDQSIGIGAYWALSAQQSLFGYCVGGLNPKVTSSVDAAVEYNQSLFATFSGFVSYRLLHFKTETAHIVSPGFAWSGMKGLTLSPRIYISRTVVSPATSLAFSINGQYEAGEHFMPFLYYTVGNESFRGVTLENVQSSDSWSFTIGGKYVVSRMITVRGSYQYLNRIGMFREHVLDGSIAWFW